MFKSLIIVDDVYDDPEKKSGGQRIVESGELEGVKAALALHVHPLLPVGKVAYKLGQALACAGADDESNRLPLIIRRLCQQFGTAKNQQQ